MAIVALGHHAGRRYRLIMAVMALTVTAAIAALAMVGAPRAAAAEPQASLRGEVLSGDMPLASTPVTLYRTPTAGTGAAIPLGRSQTAADGSFRISYPPQHNPKAVLYLIAGRGAAVRLASVLGAAPVPSTVVVNERTTVAAGFALAQFITGRSIAGKFPGPQNAAAMAANLVDARTGG